MCGIYLKAVAIPLPSLAQGGYLFEGGKYSWAAFTQENTLSIIHKNLSPQKFPHIGLLLWLVEESGLHNQWSRLFQALKMKESASQLYDVPVETLRRRVNGLIEMDCQPGPATVLLKEEEDQIYCYLLEMCDMGFGVGRET